MFILRRITGDGVELNSEIGNSYTLITKEKNPEVFADFDDPNPDTYGLIFCDYSKNGLQVVLRLNVKQINLIMTGSGQVFENISFKK